MSKVRYNPAESALACIDAALSSPDEESYEDFVQRAVFHAHIAESAVLGRAHLNAYGHPLYRKGNTCGTCGRNVK
jgi:hypothetical protein